MKIGIITIHSAYNYGAIFQAFALKEYIKGVIGENDSVYVVDYRPDFFENKKVIHFSKNIIANLIELERVAIRKKLKRRDSAFESFICENDSLSPVCKTIEQLSDVVADFDVLIAGSDQLWNFNITGGDEAYLLNIPRYNGKKLSFSSSLGGYRFYKGNEERIKNLFNDFSALSCRELDNCKYIENLTGKKCVHVCDPTFLVSADRYTELIDGKVREKIKKLAEKNFLFIYNLSSSDAVFDVARKVARARELEVYQVFPSLRKNSVVDRLLNDISPEEFLYLYSKADFIVTNSFHGTCFSLINQKDFYSINPTGSKNRLESLLMQAGLSERLLVDENIQDKVSPIETIDYTYINHNIDSYIGLSKKYIEENLFSE